MLETTAPVDNTGAVTTTRLGFGLIGIGILLLVLRAVNLVNAEAADVASVLVIVVGAVSIAIDGENSDDPDPD